MNIVEIPNAEKVASFDVDVQNTFTPVCPDELPVAGGDSIAGELNRQAAFAAYRIGSKDAHSPQSVWVATEDKPQFSEVEGYENVDIRWNLHAVPGTKGFELIDGLPRPAEYDFFVWKGVEPDLHPYGACYHDFADKISTGVIEFLQVKGVDTVLVGGLATDYCVKLTALQLRKAGFRVILNLAATKGIAEETVNAAIKEMQSAGVEIISSVADLKVM